VKVASGSTETEAEVDWAAEQVSPVATQDYLEVEGQVLV
jgi:hypothetical protein